MTRVKVCGITRIEDAILAAQLGAYALGFIFWRGSHRFIEPLRARAIADSISPNVLKVGVFVDQPAGEVTRVASEADLDAVQLHGIESVAYARDLGCRVLKAVPVTAGFTAASLDDLPDDITVLLDAHDPVRHGGTGQTIDWTLAASAAARRPIVLSGGITPGNIRDAVAQVRPYAVDLSSGVESSPGVKDPERLRALFASIRHE